MTINRLAIITINTRAALRRLGSVRVRSHFANYTRSPLQDSRLFGPRPWKVLAATYETNGFLSSPDPGENLVMENLVMETGCTANQFVCLLCYNMCDCLSHVVVFVYMTL